MAKAAGSIRRTFLCWRRPCVHSELNEREALLHVAQGYTNKQIAGHLQISVKIAEAHKAYISEKLDRHSRADMVRYTLHQGWLQEF